MIYVLFLAVAIGYNWRKFYRSRTALMDSLIQSKSKTHQEMILGHHFSIFIFEMFLAFIVADLLTDGNYQLDLKALVGVYLGCVAIGYGVYQIFLGHLEKLTSLQLKQSFNQNLVKDIRFSFGLIFLPILTYSLLNWTFEGNLYAEWGDFWLLGMFINIIFISVLTIACTVVIMLKLIPNREITEIEYLEIINKRIRQVGISGLRVRWIETDVKNAFVVGLKLLKFTNQTMFVGKGLRNALTLEEFDAVVCHELAHLANRHVHKRLIDVVKNLIFILMGLCFILVAIGIFGFFTGFPEYLSAIAVYSFVAWVFYCYVLLFENLRSHEFEADAFAVIELGANFEHLKSALEKLSAPVDLPEYLKPKKSKLNLNFFTKYFSTHPDLDHRISFLSYKIERGLPFNYYVTSSQKIRRKLGQVLQWRVLLPTTGVLLAGVLVLGWHINSGIEQSEWITKASREQILQNATIVENINTYYPLSKTPLFHVVKKADPVLIDYFLSKGADRGLTLQYLVRQKDYELLQRYYSQFSNELSEDQYYDALKIAALVNFNEGYRYLINSKAFETVTPEHKVELTRIHQRNERRRAPASSR